MNFDFTAEELALHAQIAQACAPGASVAETGRPFGREALLALLQRLSETGYLDIGLTEAPSPVQLTAAMEIAARREPEHYLALEMSTRVCGRALRRWGDATIRNELLAELCAGRLLAAPALCEGAQNTGPSGLRTTGAIEGDTIRISGEKTHVLEGQLSDCFAVSGRFGEQVALFMVPRQARGLTVGPVDGTLAGATAFVRLTLTDCRIPRHRMLVCAPGEDLLEIVRFWENQVLCAAALAEMGCAFDLANAFAKQHQNGGKPIVAYQAVAFKLAEMFTLRQTAQLLAYQAGLSAAGPEAKIDRNALTLMYCAKVFCTQAAERIASDALQIMGVHGCAPDHPLVSAFCRAKLLCLLGTSNEVAKNSIGDAMMKYLD